jgi:glycosyltransferase involved in cell wall biosynthesis
MNHSLILVLQTTTFAVHGGIPAYNRLVCRMLNQLTGPLRSCDKRILIGQDRPKDVADEARDLKNVSFEAFSGNRQSLAWRTLGLTLHQQIDLALIGHVNYAPFGLMLKRLQPRARYGVILYGIDAWQRLAPIKRRALQKADFLISISETTKKNAVSTNDLDDTRVYVLPNALGWTANNSVSTPAVNTKRLLSVCRLEQNEQYKGIDLVLRALPEVVSRIPEVSYVVVGDGSDLARHKKLASDLGVSEHVEFAGNVSEETLRAYYRDSDIFIMPSAAEGFGFVFLEAMYHAKPVVAANSGATPEVVRDGETGLLVDYGNVEQLGQAITSLCLDPELRKRLGAAGQRRLQTQFSFEQFRERFNGIISRELALPATPAAAHETRRYISRGAAS